jgi:putative FmdB family regulatory protein
MPIYDYRCENGHSFEAFQSMSEDPLTSCEVCDAPASRQLSAPAVHFKGSGFYTTDYARKGAKKSGGDDGGSADSGSKPDKGKSEKGPSSGEKAGKGSSSGGSGSSSDSSSKNS